MIRCAAWAWIPDNYHTISITKCLTTFAAFLYTDSTGVKRSEDEEIPTQCTDIPLDQRTPAPV